ncbi:1,6-dihydroxycyclohexa-2,4-diene-1-carboxylate dehydrogenase [Pedobacter immunditicola]|uniref:1,6-dihydroxycyclohexa-2,4-diene-1-carboxylate dehydrogenase n=1 Tax=Pedobacter immunditicola TaxID=3133440 RepID=UPI0030AFBCD6
MIFHNRFQHKTVLVTGAAQGIGKGVASRIAAEGGAVILVDRSPIVQEVLQDLLKENLKAIAVEADLETLEGFEQAVASGVAAFNSIDILINNVGGTIWAKPFQHYQENEIEKEVRRSLFPTLWGCHAVLPVMIKNGGGTIVNVSSVATRSVNRVPYAAAKGGVNAITQSLALEQAANNIRVVGVAPGGTSAPERLVPRNENPQTEQEKIWYQQIVDQTVNSTVLKRYGTIDEQVATILFVASDEASYLTGLTIPVGGGDLG